MATITLTQDNFEAELGKPRLLLIDWWAPWCGPCRTFGPIFEKVSDQFPDVTFAKIDTEAQPELAAAFNIRSIPTLMLFREQVLLFSRPGALSADSLQELVKQASALDMNEVRREIAEQQANAPAQGAGPSATDG